MISLQRNFLFSAIHTIQIRISSRLRPGVNSFRIHDSYYAHNSYRILKFLWIVDREKSLFDNDGS